MACAYGPYRRKSTTATDPSSGTAAHTPPSRRAAYPQYGVRAVTTAYTPTNHSGWTTSVEAVRSVSPGTSRP